MYFKYKYYKKGECNKDASQRFFAAVKKCSSSITKLEIIKINGKKFVKEQVNEDLLNLVTE